MTRLGPPPSARGMRELGRLRLRQATATRTTLPSGSSDSLTAQVECLMHLDRMPHRILEGWLSVSNIFSRIDSIATVIKLDLMVYCSPAYRVFIDKHARVRALCLC